MKTITSFSVEFKRINQGVAAITIPDSRFGESGNADFIVTLRDGRAFSFTAFTLDNIREIMSRENNKCFIAPGMVLVQSIEVESILECVEEWLHFAGNPRIPLDHFGVLQQ